MGDNAQNYIKFMSDIIESGAWADLSSGSRALYPVLLKFSDQYFKQVWPSTSTLMRLTGFKSKKSIFEAKKELIEKGLLKSIPGTGHSNSLYFFTFNYKGSKIAPQGGKNSYPGGGDFGQVGVQSNNSQGAREVATNNISITITNNKDSNKEVLNKQDLIETYGNEIYERSLSLATKKSMGSNMLYIKHICESELQRQIKDVKEESKDLDFNESWEQFLAWAKSNVTESTYYLLENTHFIQDGKTVLIDSELTSICKHLIAQYFGKNKTKIVILFAEEKARI